jgi:hypothetical protein
MWDKSRTKISGKVGQKQEFLVMQMAQKYNVMQPHQMMF